MEFDLRTNLTVYLETDGEPIFVWGDHHRVEKMLSVLSYQKQELPSQKRDSRAQGRQGIPRCHSYLKVSPIRSQK